MVTAKKASTPTPVAVTAPATAKTVATKKPAVKKTPAPAVPATVTAVTPVAPVKASAAAKPKSGSAKSAAAADSKPALNAEQRNHYVEVAAFYIAERRGFVPGNPGDDWCAAELEVDRLIASGHFN